MTMNSKPSLIPALLAAALICSYVSAAEDGLAGYWKFENASEAGKDFSGKGNNGRSGAETECVKGKFGSAIVFNGDKSKVVEVPDSESLHLGKSDFSVECWIAPDNMQIDAPDKRRRLLSKNAGKSWLVVDILSSGKVRLEMGDENGKVSSTGTENTLPINKWTHFAVVVDRKSQKSTFYLDGSLDSVKDLNPEFKGGIDVAGASLKIGGDWQLYSGLLAELKIYGRGLSAEEIRKEYEEQKEMRTTVKYGRKVCLAAEFAQKPRYSVFNPHEKLEAIVNVTGTRKNEDLLSWSISDFREKIVDKGTLPVPSGDYDWQNKLELKQLPAGYYELHLKLDRQIISLPRRGSCPPGFIAFAVLPEIEALPLEHPDDSRFGIQGTSSVSEDGDPFAPLYGLIGVKWMYDYTGEPWLGMPAWVEKTGPNLFKPELDPNAHLEKKKFQTKNRISALFDLQSVPPWLLKMPDGKAPPAPDKVVPTHNCQDYPPKDFAYYGDLLKRMVSEKAVLRKNCYPYMRRSYYQIHWEIEWYWKGSDEDFIRMYETASSTIKANDTGAFLLGPNCGVLKDGNKMLERMLSKGLGKYLDGILMHTYFLAPNGENGTSPEEGNVVAEARKLVQMARKYMPPDIPIMNTEGSSRINGYDPATNPWVLRRQAAWFLRNHLICLGEGFTSTWFFILSDNDVYSGYGMFYNLSIPERPYNSNRLAPKPVFSAVAAATRLLEGTKTVCPIEYLGENVLGYCFRRNDKYLFAVWSTDEKEREIEVPVGCRKIDFYDPMGMRSELETRDGNARIKIDGNPVYLLGVSKNAVPEGKIELSGYPGMNCTSRNWTPSAGSKYYLFNGGTRLPVQVKDDVLTVPSNAQPGTWLLQAETADAEKTCSLVKVMDPVGITSSSPVVMDRFIELSLQNRTDKELTGKLKLAGKDVGEASLKSGEEKKIRIDLADLRLVSPVPRKIAAEFKDQDGVVSRSQEMRCSVTPAQRASTAPAIDGDLSDWIDAPFYIVHGEDAIVIKNPEAPLLGDDDLSFSVASKYDDNALYLAVKVRDQSHMQTRPSGDTWQEDSVQIGVASGWDGAKWNAWQKLCVAFGNDGAVMVQRNGGSHLPTGEVHRSSIPCAIKRVQDETFYELAIPWKVLDSGLSGPPPQKRIGIGILVNDVDSPTVNRRTADKGSQQAETEVMVATVSANPKRKAMEAYGGMFWGRPEEFGILILTDKNETRDK